MKERKSAGQTHQIREHLTRLLTCYILLNISHLRLFV